MFASEIQRKVLLEGVCTAILNESESALMGFQCGLGPAKRSNIVGKHWQTIVY
jgi:hypothetical protein